MAYRDSTAASGNSRSPAVTVPVGVAANDIIILIVSGDDAAGNITAVLPAGFAALETEKAQGPDGGRALVAWKRASGADAGSYTLTNALSFANDWVAQCWAFSGRDTGNPPAIASTNNISSNASAVTATVPTITALAGDDLLTFNVPDVTATGIFNVYTSRPAGYTADETTELGFCNGAGDHLDNVSAGATGTKTYVFSLTSGASGWYAGHIRIPAVPAGGSTVKQLAALGVG